MSELEQFASWIIDHDMHGEFLPDEKVTMNIRLEVEGNENSTRADLVHALLREWEESKP